MSLVAIKQHLMQVKIASLGSLCQVFKAEPETMRCLLAHWLRKGCVRQCMKTPACGSKCFKCPDRVVEIYEWVSVPVIPAHPNVIPAYLNVIPA